MNIKRRRRSGRSVEAVESDTHGGHSLGLLNPQTELEDEDEQGNTVKWNPTPTAFQRYLWELRTENINNTKEIADGDPIDLMLLGDLTHGNGHAAHLSSNRLSDQPIIAFWNLLPWLELPNLRSVWIKKGTGIHVFGEGSTEILTAKLIQAEIDKRRLPISVNVHYHGLYDIGGALFDVSHHGPGPGTRSWLHGNVARYYLRDRMLMDINRGKPPPAIFLRGHFHVWVREWLEIGDFESWLLVCPSYCGIGEYGRKVTKSVPYQIQGGAAVEVEGGKVVRIHKLAKELDLRTKEKIA